MTSVGSDAEFQIVELALVVPQKRGVRILVLWVDVAEAGIVREEEANMLLLLNWLLYYELVQELLSLNLIRRVNFDELGELHLENPIDI